MVGSYLDTTAPPSLPPTTSDIKPQDDYDDSASRISYATSTVMCVQATEELDPDRVYKAMVSLGACPNRSLWTERREAFFYLPTLEKAVSALSSSKFLLLSLY
jgi:hypothetical protein